MNPFDELQTMVQHLISNVASGPFIGGITTYTPYIFLILILVVVIVFVAKSQLALVPKNRFVGVVEFFVDFAQNNTGYGVMGNAAKQHIPFLLTLFIFILVSNLVGIIPGSKAATGTIGTTLPLALISFVYFTYHGIKKQGGWHYLKSFAPSGLKPAPLAFVFWFLEFFSMLLRLLTLSVRLFANMLAGHLLLGVLAIMVYLFIQPIIAGITAASVGFSFLSLLWLLLLIVMYALEVFVACIQAYIFTLLSSVYVYLATEEH
ncbi:MAG: F0F1 ATP synthase subunit A [Eggerthellaceae bacterium]|jgi:F-type H+-transporting ATPase subunit a|nr:F0F1 ATP synthase subunit A [Eggerthellaceae bacterium]MDR2721878.1 F0F1 ATP synthase subunit A [Coriobacteriaceae bacterium]